MKQPIYKLALSLGFAAVFSVPTAAQAKCDLCVVNAIGKLGASLNAAIGASSAAATASVLTAQQVIVQAIATGAQIQADAAVKSSQLQAETVVGNEIQLEIQKQDARYEVADACAVTAAARGIPGANRSAIAQGGGLGRGGGGKKVRVGSNDALTRALDISSGRISPPSIEAQIGLAGQGACAAFVTAAGNPVRAESCVRAGFAANGTNGHPDADIRAETLFAGPQKSSAASGFKRSLTINPESAEQTAVEAYLRNLNTPFETRQLSKAELQTDAGRTFLAFKDVYEARMSAAEYPSRALAASKIANMELKPVVEQMLSSDVTGEYVGRYLKENAPLWNSRGISMAEMINLEGERRYLNREWHLKMASLSPEAHIKEQTTMLAYNLYLQSRMDGQLEVLAAMLGNVAATQVRLEMTPQLNALHKNAGR